MSSKKLSSSVLKKISLEKISPKPRWHFLLKNYLFWAMFFVSILLGGLGIALIFFHLEFSGISNVFDLPRGRISFLMQAIPLFWFIVFVSFLVFSSWGFHHTSAGYKFEKKFILGGNILASFILGILFFVAGTPKSIDTVFSVFPGYEKRESRRNKIWENERDGRIAGKIIEFFPKEHLVQLETRGGKIIEVDISSVRSPELRLQIIPLRYLGAFGEKRKKGKFHATFFRVLDYAPPRKRKK